MGVNDLLKATVPYTFSKMRNVNTALGISFKFNSIKTNNASPLVLCN